MKVTSLMAEGCGVLRVEVNIYITPVREEGGQTSSVFAFAVLYFG